LTYITIIKKNYLHFEDEIQKQHYIKTKKIDIVDILGKKLYNESVYCGFLCTCK